MAKTKKAGLCVACAENNHCTFPRPGQKVERCEEFVLAECRNGGRAKTAPSRLAAAPPARVGLGLCGNCDRYSDCTYPKPEGGVWHCEEYK